MKPILFNTEMVSAILDGRKTVTRRAVKKKAVDEVLGSPARLENPDLADVQFIRCLVDTPYEMGDILYVRETWQFLPCIDCMEGNCGRTPEQYEDAEMIAEGCYIYKADVLAPERVSWRPSIHMPKKAARIFLRVTNVRVSRLQDITWRQAAQEGCSWIISDKPDPLFDLTPIRENLRQLWDSTIKKANLPIYGWGANPWVWVIEFERISKEEAD